MKRTLRMLLRYALRLTVLAVLRLGPAAHQTRKTTVDRPEEATPQQPANHKRSPSIPFSTCTCVFQTTPAFVHLTENRVD